MDATKTQLQLEFQQLKDRISQLGLSVDDLYSLSSLQQLCRLYTDARRTPNTSKRKRCSSVICVSVLVCLLMICITVPAVHTDVSLQSVNVAVLIDHPRIDVVYTFGRVCISVCLSDENFRN